MKKMERAEDIRTCLMYQHNALNVNYPASDTKKYHSERSTWMRLSIDKVKHKKLLP